MSTSARTWWRVPLGFLLGLVVFAIAGPTSRLPDRLLQSGPDVDPWLSTLTFQITMGIVAVLIMLIIGRGNLRRFGFQRGSQWRLVRVALIVLAAELLISLAFLPFPKPGPDHFAADFTWWQTLIGVLIVASTLEEVVARGLVQTIVDPLRNHGLHIGRLNLSVPVLTGAVYFSAMHIPLLVMGIDTVQGIHILCSTFALGLIAGYFRESSGSLIPAVIAHMLANVYGMGLGELFGWLGIG